MQTGGVLFVQLHGVPEGEGPPMKSGVVGQLPGSGDGGAGGWAMAVASSAEPPQDSSSMLWPPAVSTGGGVGCGAAASLSGRHRPWRPDVGLMGRSRRASNGWQPKLSGKR